MATLVPDSVLTALHAYGVTDTRAVTRLDMTVGTTCAIGEICGYVWHNACEKRVVLLTGRRLTMADYDEVRRTCYMHAEGRAARQRYRTATHLRLPRAAVEAVQARSRSKVAKEDDSDESF